jgi:hypothetical protein
VLIYVIAIKSSIAFSLLSLSVKASTFLLIKFGRFEHWQKRKVVKMSKQLLTQSSTDINFISRKPKIKQLKLPIRISHKLEQKPSLEQRFGRSGEQFANCVISKIFNLNGYKVQHNDWKTYITRHSKGCDVKIFKDNGLIIAIEVKNWRSKKYQWGKDHIYEQIVTRFEGFESAIKILFISFKKMLTESALKMLAKYHIFVFEVEQTFTKKDRHFPDFFYDVVKRFKQFITDITENSARFFSNCSDSISILNSDLISNNQYVRELREINRVTDKITNKVLDNELIELSKLIDTPIPNMTNTNTDNVTNNITNNQSNQNKTKKESLDNSLISDNSKSLSQLFSANNKSLIANYEHENWLKDRISTFLATIAK